MADLSTILLSAGISTTTTAAAIWWLGGKWAENRFARNLKEHEAALRRQVEDWLGDQAADRQYRLEARKRLYSAIAPLRFQLLVACSNYLYRIQRIGSGQQAYNTSIDNYFGQSTFYRLARLLAIGELIERQITYADFTVDPSTLMLLRFKHALFRALSNSDTILDHPNANWNEQVEHVYFDVLPIIASALIVEEEGVDRVIRFDEVDDLLASSARRKALDPLPRLFEALDRSRTPLLWVRLVAAAELCCAMVSQESLPTGLTVVDWNAEAMLKATGDEYILANLDRYVASIRTLPDEVILKSAASAPNRR
jgi:hypothetical protein